MNKVLGTFLAMLLPTVATAAEVWKWHSEDGVIHYSNVARSVPAGAAVVDARITLEVEHIPPSGTGVDLTLSQGRVYDASAGASPVQVGAAASRFVPLPDAPRVYDSERRRFGCFAAGILYSGGFAQPNDISAGPNCLPYRLGPEAWLNAARAELAMRENGINPREMMNLYLEEGLLAR